MAVASAGPYANNLQHVDFNLVCVVVTFEVNAIITYPMVSRTHSKLQLHLCSIQF